ncbi:hypothetical protein JOB18_037036 [Solea senegalensis]|uniref:Uncharacterized protein n=1 Tax=Solea senegalensis TaxID=28829 RepID=A0AAV6R5Z0_SOLSE|nr:hypothetical protein JOB18_037036 [Solea senegalensis]
MCTVNRTQHLHSVERVTEAGGVSRISYGGELSFLFRVWPGQSFQTGCSFEILCAFKKMFRSTLSQRGPVLESAPAPQTPSALLPFFLQGDFDSSRRHSTTKT